MRGCFTFENDGKGEGVGKVRGGVLGTRNGTEKPNAHASVKTTL